MLATAHEPSRWLLTNVPKTNQIRVLQPKAFRDNPSLKTLIFFNFTKWSQSFGKSDLEYDVEGDSKATSGRRGNLDLDGSAISAPECLWTLNQMEIKPSAQCRLCCRESTVTSFPPWEAVEWNSLCIYLSSPSPNPGEGLGFKASSSTQQDNIKLGGYVPQEGTGKARMPPPSQRKKKNASMTAWFRTARGPWETYSLKCVLVFIGFFFMQIFCLITSLVCLNHCLWESMLNGSRTWMDPKLWIFLLFFFWFFNPWGFISWHANKPLTAIFKNKKI